MELAIGLVHAALEEANVLLQIASDRGRRDQQAVPLGREHAEQLAPAGEEGIERLDRLVRQRPGSGPHALGEERQDLGIERVGLRELASGLGEVAHLAGIGDHDGQAGRGEGGDGRRLVATGGFEHEERRREPVAAGDQLLNARLVVGHGAGLAAGADGELELGFGDIDPDERHTDLLDETARVGPTLQDAGSWPTQLFGLSAKGVVRRPS